MKFDQMKDGEWCRLPRRACFIRCCDCGLIHRLEFRIVAGKIRFKAYRQSKLKVGRRKVP